ASIARGADGVNRNLIAADQPEWNWHVTSVSDFGDVGIELLDGWPGQVESHLDDWMRETGGKIGFWNYTVSAELTGYPQRVPPIPVPLPAALAPALLTAALALFASRRWRSITL